MDGNGTAAGGEGLPERSWDRPAAIRELGDGEFDLVVFGGGIFGAVTAWQGAVRGLRTALIEADDFGSGSSANSYKVIHGGIRYVQHFDLPRVLASCRERSAFLRIAPHLCEPLPIVIPTYGWGKLGMPFLFAGCCLYDLITLRRNRGIRDPARRIPFTRLLSRRAVLAEFPDIESRGLTGACVIHDGRFYNPTRLVWAFCDDLRARGGTVINRARVVGLERGAGRVSALRVHDLVGDREVTVRGQGFVNATGPWAERWLETLGLAADRPRGTWSRDACFIVRNRRGLTRTLAVQGATGDPDALLAREKRHLFVSPWRDEYLLIGVWHKVTDSLPEALTLERDELASWLRELNAAYPALGLEPADVIGWNIGLVPFGDEQSGDADLSYGKRSHLVDHASSDGLENLFSLIGLRYTMARAEGHKVLERLGQRLGWRTPAVETDRVALRSAAFERFDTLVSDLALRAGDRLDARTVTALAHNRGSDAFAVLDRIDAAPDQARCIGGSTLTRAELALVCRHEAVECLADAVLRRTDLASGENPGPEALADAAAVVAETLGWSQERRALELKALEGHFMAFVDGADGQASPNVAASGTAAAANA